MNTVLIDRPTYRLEMGVSCIPDGNHLVTLSSTDGTLSVYLDDAALDRLIAGLMDARTTPLLANPKQMLLGLDENGCARN